MVYPVVVLVIAAAILTFLLIFIVPKFQQIFQDALPGKPLPAITLFVIGCSHLLVDQWYIPVGVIVLMVVGYKALASSTAGVIFLDRIALKIPVFGDLTSKTAISRFARTLGTLISSGVPILQALNITRDTAGNTIVANAINKIHDSVKEGESVVGPMEASGVFPPMVTSMVQVGEETGQLPDMLVKVADVYEGEVDNVVSGLTSILEPIMIVMLAVIVGTIVIALFMPMVGLITGMSDQANGH
jgi:type IV pilus assembly protein PilC